MDYIDKIGELREKIPRGTVAHSAHSLGVADMEPLTRGLEDAVRFAVAYEKRFGGKIASDGSILGDSFREWIEGLHGLLNGDGCVAMERNITTDSKDNSYCEDVYCLAMEEAGFEEE